MPTLAGLVDAHAVLTMEQQLHFADVVGDRDWNADLEAGTLSFGRDLTFDAELVGTEAGSFMWAWANPGAFPDHVTATSRTLRAIGEEHGIAELAEGEVELDDEHPGARLVVAAVGQSGAPAYYAGPTGGGAYAYLLVGDNPALALPPLDAPRMMTTLTLVLEGGYVTDWPSALEAYARQRELTLTRPGGALRLEGPTLGGHAQVELDALGRVAELTGSAGPAGGEAPRRGLLGRLRRR